MVLAEKSVQSFHHHMKSWHFLVEILAMVIGALAWMVIDWALAEVIIDENFGLELLKG